MAYIKTFNTLQKYTVGKGVVFYKENLPHSILTTWNGMAMWCYNRAIIHLMRASIAELKKQEYGGRPLGF